LPNISELAAQGGDFVSKRRSQSFNGRIDKIDIEERKSGGAQLNNPENDYHNDLEFKTIDGDEQDINEETKPPNLSVVNPVDKAESETKNLLEV
jgi:hypothetical protein